MKKYFNYLGAILLSTILVFASCSKDEDEPTPDPTPDPGESTTELLVKKFSSAPELDGTIDDMWSSAQRLVGTTEVPTLAARGTWLNSDGEGVEEGLGLFEPYSGDQIDYKLRAGVNGDRIYFLLEWDDNDNSMDRESWYFDGTWKQQHKYANTVDDKYYEDKFSFLFPIGTVDGFNASTCYATCHANLDLVNDKDKHTRHYLTTDGQKIDMWHWKRVRGTYMDQIDDQKMGYVAPPYNSSSNGRGGDATGQSGYSNNKQALNNGTDDVSVPLYIIPGATNYHWIDKDQIADGTAVLIVGVDGDGVLELEDGTFIDPAEGGFEKGIGNKRLPSVHTREFTEGRADLDIKAVYTGTGWICEFTRKLNTGDADDVIFDVTQELAFGLAIFDNAAIAHSIKPGLLMKFEQ